MPRPSLKAVRTEELLDAFERCVARFGLDGSTLDRISEEANVGRPLLRHYLGNREEMVAKLLDHVLGKFSQMNELLITTLPEKDRVSALLEILFDKESHQPENAAVFQALIAASERYPEIVGRLMGFVDEFEAALAREFIRENPKADINKCQTVAAGIASIYFNHDTILPLQPTRIWQTRQKAAAQMLLDTMK